jgi:laccase
MQLKSISYCFNSHQNSVITGEWWNANVVDVENEGLATGAAPNVSDAFTINGKPGDLYQCSENST